MDGAEQFKWLLIIFAGAMICIGVWMKHRMDVLNRRIEHLDKEERRRTLATPAE